MNEYDELYNRTWADIPEPKTLPEGSWVLKATSAARKNNEDNDKMGPTVNVVFSVVEPMNDVDTGELDALGDNYDVTGNKIFHKFFLRDGGSENVRKFLKNLGIYDETLTPDENLKLVKGQQVVAFLGQRPYKDRDGNERVDNVIKAFSVAE